MIKLKELVKLNESIYDKGIFKAIYLAGIPGAGKSYTISQITDGSLQPKIVNTDKFLEFLYRKYDFSDIESVDVSRLIIDLSKKSTINQLASFINSMLPLFVDSTSNNMVHLLRRDGILKSFGYDTGMIWVNTDVDEALKRIKQRERQVSDKAVYKIFNSLQEYIPYYKKHFKLFVTIDNNTGELTNDVILSAYKKVSSFFNENIENPIGKENYNKANKTSGYLTPRVYEDINKIKSKLSGWY